MPAPIVVEPDRHNRKAGIAGRSFLVAAATSLWVAIPFVAAGRLDWIRGWICIATYLLTISAVGLLLFRTNPELIAARGRLNRKDTKPFDKIIISIFLPMNYVLPAVAGLDAVRFHWSSMPWNTLYWGFAVFEFAMAIIAWAMMVNPFAESTVRIQKDRDQKAVTSGPYRMIRHPMYLGIILMYPAIALMFGSRWALVVAGVIAILFIFRTAMEDRTLRRELPGYEEYAGDTPYRLLPGVW